jgi:hypothetical protein
MVLQERSFKLLWCGKYNQLHGSKCRYKYVLEMFMLVGDSVVTAYAVYVVSGVSGDVLCHGWLC